MPNPLEDLTGKNIIVDDVPLPDRKVLELVSGDNVTLEAADDSVNGRTVITVSATGVGGGGVSESVAASVPTWNFSDSTATSPDVGEIRFNDAVLDATEIYASYYTASDANLLEAMLSLRVGDTVHVQQGGSWATCRLTAAPTDDGYILLPIAVESRGGSFVSGEPVHVTPIPSGRRAEPTWTFSATTTDADPGDSVFRLNHASGTSATFLYLDDKDSLEVTWAEMLAGLSVGAYVAIQQTNSEARWLYRVTGAPTDATGYVKIPVAYVSSRGAVAITNGASCAFSFEGAAVLPTGTAQGQTLVWDGSTWSRKGILSSSLTDASATVAWSTASRFVSTAVTLTASRTTTIGTSGSPPTKGVIYVESYNATAFTRALVNGGPAAGTLYTCPANTNVVAALQYNGTDWSLVSVVQLS